MTELIQVGGGSISFIIGANLWSSNDFYGESTVVAGATIVSSLLAIFRNCSVSGSMASTSTGSGTRKFEFIVSLDVSNLDSRISFVLNGSNQVLSATRGWPRHLVPS